MSQEFDIGSLVKLYDREWVVMPSVDNEIINLKPLGGMEEEAISVFKGLRLQEDKLEKFNFSPPSSNDAGDFATARLLYNASRLLFRNGAGPFRCFGKLSFRPRSYQLVPLILSLRQKLIRLLIADDVGIGKTIEAGIIVRELIDRGELNSFAVICLPHLCEQWQQELKDKFSIDAVIIRSGTIRSLERSLLPTQTIFTHYPYQIISIDYVKSETHNQQFIRECPEFVIVDEAHTCSNTGGQKSSNQQQRYKLLKALSANQKRHLLLLTATPHSGIQQQFQSLLGLLNQRFEQPDFDISRKDHVRELSENYIQRQRKDIEKFVEETPFPKRDSKEIPYEIGDEYAAVFDKLVAFAREIVKDPNDRSFKQRVKFWAALALLRGVMSSPAAGIEMLRNRAFNKNAELAELLFEEGKAQISDSRELQSDKTSGDMLEQGEFSEGEVRKLKSFATELESIGHNLSDRKAHSALTLAKSLLKDKLHPIIFCRYIETANYLGEFMRKHLKKEFPKLEIEIVTGEMHDDQRKEKVEALGKQDTHLLICTDCLSEGINLQEHFNSIIHYDLPWNPNRLEQREGRVDRFGQECKEVKTFMLYGKDNPMDGVVLKVLLRKAIQIRKEIGVAVPFPEDSETVMEAVGTALFFNEGLVRNQIQQGKLDFGPSENLEVENKLEQEYEKAKEKHTKTHDLFAQHGIMGELNVGEDIRQMDDALGNPESVREFVINAVGRLGGQIDQYKKGFRLFIQNLPLSVAGTLSGKEPYLLSFESPTPEGYRYIGRNNPFTEQLCRSILANAFHNESNLRIARCSAFRSGTVKTKTTLIVFRIRNVIRHKSIGNELVAEELLLYSYEGRYKEGRILTKEEANKLLFTAVAVADLNENQRKQFLEEEIKEVLNEEEKLKSLVKTENENLVSAHERYRKALGSEEFEVGSLIPPDILGIYILFPELTN
ncbi:MAG: helicase-related protein [Bacteroidia bacterium]